MNTDQKLKNLAWYAKRNWPIFPCGPDKKPLTHHGFKDATVDLSVIKAWHEKYPEANWGMSTGPQDAGGAGLVVIDIDAHDPNKNGFETWGQLREQFSEPIETVTVRTGGGGSQLYFKYPVGHVVKSGTDVLGPGLDIRAKGGYVIIPPSRTQARYTFEFSPADTEIMELPEWILFRINGAKEPAVKNDSSNEPIPSPVPDDRQLASAVSALNALNPKRADDYQQWLEVGMALFPLGQDGLNAWDQWSRQSEKYERGACAQKWKTFSKELTDASKISFGSLIHWAEEDGLKPIIRQAPKRAAPQDYAAVLEAFGYKFSMNDMNDQIYLGVVKMNDVLMSTIEYNLRNYEYRSEKDTQIAIYKTAHDNIFHPIKDYLGNLIREGRFDGDTMKGVDHI